MNDSLFATIYIVLSTAASDHVEDGADGHAPTNDITYPNIQLGEAQRRAEDVKQGLDPEWVNEGAVLMDNRDLEDDSKEEKRKEAIIALTDYRINIELAIGDRDNGEDYGQYAKTNHYRRQWMSHLS